MSPHDRLDEQIGELSSGRLTFDRRAHKLTRRGPAGADQELEISERELRGLLQRLLMAAPTPAVGEPLEIAVCLLLEHLDAQL